MCPVKESREFLSEKVLSKDGEEENEEGNKGDRNKTCHGFLGGLPSKQVLEELKSLGRIACPIVITSLLLHAKSIISMLFLGHLGNVELAGGTLSMGFANITGYSIIKGLAMGMEPICCQAYGAKRWSVLSQAYQKTLLLLLLATIPISLLWLNMEELLLWSGQDPDITSVAKVYITFSIPDLLGQANFYPLRIFLRSQCLTKPITIASFCAIVLHLPINYFLVMYLNMGVEGVALASSWFTLNLNLILLVYLAISKAVLKPWSTEASMWCFQGWKTLVALAVPSVLSVCLEWWWYEVMLLLSGLLINPKASVAAMGILIQVTGLIYVFPSSLSLGTSTRVGHELGADQPASARFASIIGIAVAASCGLSAFGFTIILRNSLGKLFTSEPEVVELTSIVLPILGFCELGNCPQTVACGVLTGSARPKVGAKINFTSFYLIGLPLAILLGFQLKVGFVGLWFGLVAAQMSCMCFMVYTIICTDWNYQAKRANELTYKAEGSKDDLEAYLLR
ncbi:hypothetical protein IFM89_021167 [Coptis chinensis]|uniref:Protein DETOXIFICATION n=1 Tax=Coptis chinensis TaxID=261450 RepID=A0A835HE68_9MAGN|nr:hypothetical protein IFM89_021167 [Coptis chinensis]